LTQSFFFVIILKMNWTCGSRSSFKTVSISFYVFSFYLLFCFYFWC